MTTARGKYDLLFASNDDMKIQDNITTRDDQVKFRTQRANLLFRNERWNETLIDIVAVKSITDWSPELKLMKMKAKIQKQMGKYRSSLEYIISTGNASVAHHDFLSDIRKRNIDELLNGDGTATVSRKKRRNTGVTV